MRRFGWCRPGRLGVRSPKGLDWLSRWLATGSRRKLRQAVGQPVNADRMEISRLKAELTRMRMERDIPKKAAAYFAKELP